MVRIKLSRLGPVLTVVVTLLLMAVVGWLALQQRQLAAGEAALRRTMAEQSRQLAQFVAALQGGAPGQRSGMAGAATGSDVASLPGAPAGARTQNGKVFELGVLQLTLEAIARKDAAKERALVGYLTGLPEQPFRQQMLMLLRDRSTDPVAAKQAGAALAGVSAQPSATGRPLSTQATKLPFGQVSDGRPDGWDYDLFICRVALERHDPYLDSEVSRLLGSLKQADPQHGRIVLQPLDERLRQSDPALTEPGLFVLADLQRSDEAERAKAVAKRLAFDGFDFRVRAATSAPTPWLMSLVYCPE